MFWLITQAYHSSGGGEIKSDDIQRNLSEVFNDLQLSACLHGQDPPDLTFYSDSVKQAVSLMWIKKKITFPSPYHACNVKFYYELILTQHEWIHYAMSHIHTHRRHVMHMHVNGMSRYSTLGACNVNVTRHNKKNERLISNIEKLFFSSAALALKLLHGFSSISPQSSL